MSTPIKPAWWDRWVVYDLYDPKIREDAPQAIKDEFDAFIANNKQVVL